MGLFDDIVNTVKDVATDIVTNPTGAYTNYTTGGLLSYQDGAFSEGVYTHALDEGVGQISGRNLQRKAIMDAKDALAEEKAAAAKDVINQNDKKQRADEAASQYAGILRRTNQAKINFSLGNQEQDFLGL